MEACDEEISKSLRRSKIRVAILIFINRQYFRQANLKIICKELGISPSSALGALLGSNKRYKAESSLVGLGLLERLETDLEIKIIQYRITERGARIASNLENEPMTSTILGTIPNAEQ
jgi:predicted transcriptional regulator with HTH domain